MPSTEMEQTGGWNRIQGKGQKFDVCPVELNSQSSRHLTGEIETVRRCMSLELREAWTTDKNEGTITI